MNFHVLTLFPEMIDQGVRTSITGRAIEKGVISLELVNIRDYTKDKHKKVDDYPYGGGAGIAGIRCVLKCDEELKGQNAPKGNLYGTAGPDLPSADGTGAGL